MSRAAALVRWGRGRRIDIETSHNSYSQLLAARWLGVPATTTMDYEFQSVNHLAFRLARRVVVPASFPDDALRRFGAAHKITKYEGIKGQVYLSDFVPQPGFRRTHGLGEDAILAVVRPAADWALYHRRLQNPLPALLLERLPQMPEVPEVEIVYLPRLSSQVLVRSLDDRRIHIPGRAWDGPALAAAADVVFSAGGTMVREAAVIGTPAYSLFAGTPPAVDRYLAGLGRLTTLRTAEDVAALRLGRKPPSRSLLTDGDALARVVANMLLNLPVSREKSPE